MRKISPIDEPEPLRIAHVCSAFSPLSHTFIYDQVKTQQQRGHAIVVLAFERMNETDRPFDNVCIVNRPSFWNRRRLWWRFKLAMGKAHAETLDWSILRPRFTGALDGCAPDLIHAHFGSMGALVGPVAQQLGIPLVTTFYGTDVSQYTRQAAWCERYRVLFEQADLLIGISNHICDKLRALGAPPDKVVLQHLGVRLEQFAYSNPAERYDGGTVHALHVGRLVEKKAPLHLVRAFKHARTLLDGTPDLHLTIVGDGPLYDPLVREIDALGLSDHVDVLGSMAHHEVRGLMQRAHLYTQHCVTASNGDQEGQGVTFVEASASGLPIVSTRHNGLPDVILDEETGFLVEEGDTEAMGARIAHLARRPDLWRTMGARGRQHIEQHFDLNRQTACAEAHYRSVLHPEVAQHP